MGKVKLELHFWYRALAALHGSSPAGLVVAAFCYRQFFPNPYDDDGIHFLFFYSFKKYHNCCICLKTLEEIL